jgi:cytochrome oxidase Cu insertion factor (SCO1/SenC/PrrC family)
MTDIDVSLKVLGLARPVTREQVKNAHRELLKVWHPDRFENDEKLRVRAEAESKKLNEAVAVLDGAIDRGELGQVSRADEPASALKPHASPPSSLREPAGPTSGTAQVSAPHWLKSPFVWAFVLGAVVLTILPVMQRRFLKAPPPIAPLVPWSLSTVDEGASFGSQQLRGSVYLVAFAPGPCDAACVDRQKAFGRGLEHTDDLGTSVHLVSFARQEATSSLKGLAKDRWHLVTGSDDQLLGVLASFHAAWSAFANTDAGVTLEQRLSLPAFAVVDQDGQVRGFWRDDVAGRGNAINAARLLAKYGPAP